MRGNIRIQDRDQIVVQTGSVNIPRGLTDFQLPRRVFNTAPLDVVEWAFVLAWAPVIFLLDELRKAFLRLREHRLAR